MYAATSRNRQDRSSAPSGPSRSTRDGGTLARRPDSEASRLARLIPATGRPSPVQRAPLSGRTRIGAPNDRHEREADRTADRVMSMPLVQRQPEEEEEPIQAKPLIQRQAEKEEEEAAQAKPLVQRQAEEEEEEAAQAKPLVQRQAEEEEEEAAQARPLVQRQAEEEEEAVQTKSGRGGRVSAALQARLDSAKSGGDSLPTPVRTEMETHFGRDFSGIRVHTDHDAVAMSQELRAQAFTHGSHIFFNASRYAPGSSQGRHLLAHELTHTVQQGAAGRLARQPQTQGPADRQAETIDTAAELAASEAEATTAADPTAAAEAKKKALTTPPAKGKKEAAAAEEKGRKEKEPAEKPEPGAEAAAPQGEAPAGEFALALPAGEEERGEVGRYLEAKSGWVLGRVKRLVGRLAANEKTHDPAQAKLEQSKQAVKAPPTEGQAQSNAEQVETVDRAKTPTPDAGKGKLALRREIEAAVPSSIKEINQFKARGKAKVVGNKVLGAIKQETDAVETTYGAIEQPKPPKAPAREPQELPTTETAPETGELALGRGAVPPLKEEHTDFSEYDRKSDELLEKEGISNEQLNMVDEGDLYEARKERDGVKQKVAEEPAAIQSFARDRVLAVNTSLKAKEAQTKATMRARRDRELAATKTKQQQAKSALEKKRDEVAKKINGIYQKTKKSITGKLKGLESKSLKRFDQGQAKASRQFEYEVHRDINRWKRKRYSGFWGPAKWIKDKICGINDFPEVKNAFSRARAKYVTTIDQLILTITLEANLVIMECKTELALARAEIKTYVGGLEPALKKIGRQAMGEMQAKLDALDGDIDRKKKQLAQKLADKRAEAIKKIDEKIEKMKEAMAGALAKLGNLIIGALVKFFKWALKKAGYNAKQLMGILNKGKAVIKKIVGDPIGFLGNIVDAVKQGVNNFKKNIKKHLVGGLISWLTGAMGDVDITLPPKFDLKGVLSFVLQILGLTWSNIRKKLVKRLGEKTVGMAEKTFAVVKRLVVEGPMALWSMIKEKAAAIKQQVIEGIRNWVAVELVKQGIIKLLSFLNPVGALIQAILAIYNTVMFFVENWDRIVQFVKTVFRSIVDIALGRIGAAAAAVERSLAMTIPIILNFLARLLNLSGIGKAVKKIIKKIRAPIDRVINRAVDLIAKKAKPLLAKGKALYGKAKARVAAFFSVGFRMGKSSHTLEAKERGGRSVLVMRSATAELRKKIDRAQDAVSAMTDEQKKKKMGKDLRRFRKSATKIERLPLATDADKRKRDSMVKDLAHRIQAFGAKYGVDDLIPSLAEEKANKEVLEQEGKVGTYSGLTGTSTLTPDHEPQNAVLASLKLLKLPSGHRVFTADQPIASYNTADGICLLMYRARHKLTRTYGGAGGGTKRATLRAMDVEPKNWKIKAATRSEARGKVKGAVTSALDADQGRVREIYNDQRWQLPKEVKERVAKGIAKVKSRNFSKWPEVFSG